MKWVLRITVLALLGLSFVFIPRLIKSPSPELQDPVFDDFERSKLGRNWTVYNGDMGISEGNLAGFSKSSPALLSRLGLGWRGLGVVAWSMNSLSPDQFSEAKIAAQKDPDVLLQVFVRRRSSDKQRYGFHWRPLEKGQGQWEIKLDGAVGAPVVATARASGPPASGDTLRIEAIENTLRGLHNGIEVISATHSTLTEAGEPGMAWGVSRIANFPAHVVDEWSGGSLRTRATFKTIRFAENGLTKAVPVADSPKVN